jgi:pimeloyl-ACP methyl ester carboxylesterase
MKENIIKTKTLDIFYRQWGNDKSNPYLLIHGLASNSRIWDLIAPILATTKTVIAMDTRGHGKTEKPSENYDFETISNDIDSFIKCIGIKMPILIGHSWGGSIALHYTATHLQKTKGLVFVDGGLIDISNKPGNTLSKALIDMAPPVFSDVTKAGLQKKIQARSWGSRDTTSLNSNLDDIVLSNFTENSDGTIIPRFNRKNHLQVIKELWGHDPKTFLNTVKGPVLNLPARTDNHQSNFKAYHQNLIDYAESHVEFLDTIWLENSIHDVPLQKPELVANTIINWAKKHGI